MTSIRALVLADSPGARRLFAEAMADEPDIEVVGTAATKAIALVRLKTQRPDVMIALAETAGVAEAVRAIREAHPRLPVLVFSMAGAPSPAALREWSAHGATVCAAAPSEADRETVARCLREVLLPRIRALCLGEPGRPQRVEIVAIGISTGGPNALAVLLSELPSDFAVPVLIVQHMPPVFTRQLAERLNMKCAITVSEAEPGALLHPGQVWLAPGGRHLVVVSEAGRVRLELNEAPPENSCRPSVDPLFTSVAVAYGAGSLGIVMTGMGRDGLRGCEAIRKAGGRILAQDEATSVVWGMPGSVVRAGLADAVIPLPELGAEILRRVQAGRHSESTIAAHGR